MNPFLRFCISILPKSLVSRIAGAFSRTSLSRGLIESYCRKYQVNLEEANVPQDGFRSFQDFYTRSLKKGVRTVTRTKDALVSPVDGSVTQCGPITGTRIMQAKDLDFLVSDLLPADVHHMFIDGYFATFSLHKGGYHRVHAPCNASISSLVYCPGTLFPLELKYTDTIRRIFTKNERLITILDTPYGKCALCMIGAMNSGKMTVHFEDIITNSRNRKKQVFDYSASQPAVHTGDELGRFMSGSAVILLFEKDIFEPESLRMGADYTMGQKLGILTNPVR